MKKTTILTVLGLFVLAGCGGSASEDEATLTEPVEVTVSVVTAGRGSERYVGTLEADQTAPIATRMSGVVSAVPVHEGMKTSAGDVLVRLDTTDLMASVRAAESRERLAERSWNRVAALAGDGAASQQELDEVEAALEAARAATEGARAQVEYAVIRAPFDGIVTARHIDPGALAVPGQPLVTLQSMAATTVRAALPAALWSEVPPGRHLEVRDLRSAWMTVGRVTRRAPAIGDASRRFQGELAVEPDPGAPVPGTHVDIQLPETGDATLWIPADAVVTRGQLTGAWTVEGDRLGLRWLRTGRREAGRLEVLAGLEEGDLIVRSPAFGLVDGQPVSGATLVEWNPGGGFADRETGEEGAR